MSTCNRTLDDFQLCGRGISTMLVEDIATDNLVTESSVSRLDDTSSVQIRSLCAWLCVLKEINWIDPNGKIRGQSNSRDKDSTHGLAESD